LDELGWDELGWDELGLVAELFGHPCPKEAKGGKMLDRVGWIWIPAMEKLVPLSGHGHIHGGPEFRDRT
jgi:hypothetical protein